MQFITFFNVEVHFKQIQNKVIRCITTPTVYLNLAARMPDILEIFTHDIEKEIHKLCEDINYQRSIKQIKLSNRAFQKLMEEGFEILFSNYIRVLGDIGGGCLLQNTSISKQDFDIFKGQSQKFYNLTLAKVLLKSKKEKSFSRYNSLTLVCAVIAAITGIISLLSS